MNIELELGTVLEVSKNGGHLVIDENYKVYADSIPVGDLIGNLTHFPETIAPKHYTIDKIVYMGNYKWSIKHLVDPLDEFDRLSRESKQNILKHYQHLEEQEYHEHMYMNDMERPWEMHPYDV